MTGAMVDIGPAGGMSGYRSAPREASAPGLILIQEIFGVNQTMRKLADSYAARGFVTLCPDLFWRQEPAVSLSDGSEADRSKAMRLLQGFNEGTGVSDLEEAAEALRQDSQCDGTVFAVGYCLGGRLAVALAGRNGVAAAVAYYPVALDGRADLLTAVRTPLLVHLGEADPLVPEEAQGRLIEALSTREDASVTVYGNAGHAFARAGSSTYVPAAAESADAATLQFLSSRISAAAT